MSSTIGSHVSRHDVTGWSATVYRSVASYVYSPEATASVLQSLDANPGERILDLGCGSGDVTVKIAHLVGPEGIVVGVDLSENMIAMARETTMLPDIHLIVGDIQEREFLKKLPTDFVGDCDKVFSNAALHWCSRDPLAVLVNVHRILKEGGLFVAEMGGHGNIAGVRDALHAALRKRGIDPIARDPWFFPTPEEYTALLRSAGLEPFHVSLRPRSTSFGDLAGWIRLFGGTFLEGIGSKDKQELVNEVVASCRESGACHWDDEKMLWNLEYVRLRVVAAKAGIHGDLQDGRNRLG
ncbi:S-adenosyl-L-methionine-dependent methyltransferase [Russula earlei]|uniref:S-adenosyl-L-methionine-dependent methyltransferase n=1 Tax=Russula earlei TaxID=71964 RepID=A0ACC0U0B2_9AGAM|nr:S-adenosyl-L-methionine-dependent methyltransferase [Russula earlei]